ncbi:MAG: hypothetical protein R3F56_05335 [Planctomycetota bacterium]
MHTPDAPSDDDRFPSGPWTGFFLDPRHPGRHRMDLDLTFTRGKIGGGGADSVGAFTVFGRYSDDGECRWTKEYPAHDVVYRGFREGKGIWGTWELQEHGRAVRGGFQIWPKGHGEGIAESVEAEAPAPLALAGSKA